MKAIVVNEFGGPEKLEVADTPTPTPGPGQVLIAVEAAGVGYADALLRQGALPTIQPGFTPGLEMAGTVAKVGEGVDNGWLNSRVFAMLPEGVRSGCYAEFVAVDADQLVPIPLTITSSEAVSLGVNALVAEFVVRRAQVKAGEQVLLSGASGGIGVLLVQVAAQRGAVVTASTSSTEAAERLLKLGASHAVDRSGEPLSGGSAPDAYDAILDVVAGPDLLKFTGKLNKNGRLVLCGIVGGVPPAELAMALIDPRSLSFSMLSLDSIADADRQTALREIFTQATRGELTAVIHESLDLTQASQAHQNLEAGQTFGKIVLQSNGAAG